MKKKIFDIDQSTVIFDGQLKEKITWYTLKKKKIY